MYTIFFLRTNIKNYRINIITLFRVMQTLMILLIPKNLAVIPPPQIEKCSVF